MDSLRISLLIIGGVIIALIFFWERIRRRKRESRYERWGGVSEDGRETRIVGHRSGDPETDASLVASAYLHPDTPAVKLEPENTNIEQQEAKSWRDDVEASLQEPDLDIDPELQLEDPVPELTSELEALEEIISSDDDIDHSVQIEIDDLVIEENNAPIVGDEIESSAVSSKANKTPAEARIIAMHILASNGEKFAGPDILSAVMRAGLQFGDLGIFHRHDEQGATLFSLANAIEPGTFDLAAMDELATPALLLIMQLPGPFSATSAFDLMLESAQDISESLGGRLCDERRSVLTKQAIEELRRDLVTQS